MPSSSGIHHITAIAGEPRRHVAFYRSVLGLRLVKRTVNFDDPTTWHLYYGDETGSPGTVLTFFVWPKLPQGHHGAGEAQDIAFAIPEGAIEFWKNRLTDKNIPHKILLPRFGETAIGFTDPHGLKLELVVSQAAAGIPGWSNGEIPVEHAIRGFHGVTLEVIDFALAARVLTEVFGFRDSGSEENRRRFLAEGSALGSVIDLRMRPGIGHAAQGAGSVHHVAFRATGDAEQMEFRARALALGLRATDQVLRLYFRSVYFREPGGILFEIATDDPGFMVDEPVEKLGASLMLPPWHEQLRARIEATLPPLEAI